MKVYIGIDWSEGKHDVVFMNEAGVDLAVIVIPHSPEGFAQFDAKRRQLGLTVEQCVIGLETAYNILIDFLWSQEYPQIYVLAPNQVKSNQGRFRQSGAKDDPSDARLIADILRTDRRRLQPWQPDQPLTRQIQATVSLSMLLNKQVNQFSNQLRAVLLRYYPAALRIFSTGLTSQITPAFILAYPTPQAARGLSYLEFETFAREHGYPKPQQLRGCFARLHEPYPEASPETVQVCEPSAVILAELLLATTRKKLASKSRLKRLYPQHPKYPTFSSLPATGEWIGPALLGKFGDDPERFPTPATAKALAGTVPVTRRSGNRKTVSYRQACDKEWRYIVQQWAFALVHNAKSPIAIAYYASVRPRCQSDAHAYRCLGDRWMSIAWKLWRTDQTYDEAYHFQQRAQRSKPRVA
jgi:transposase